MVMLAFQIVLPGIGSPPFAKRSAKAAAGDARSMNSFEVLEVSPDRPQVKLWLLGNALEFLSRLHPSDKVILSDIAAFENQDRINLK